MSTSTKLQYLYDNYLAQLMVGVVLLTVVGIIITSVYNKTRHDDWLNIGILDYDGLRNLIEEEQDETTGSIQVMAYQGVNYESLKSGAAHNTVMGITAMIAAGDLDVMMASAESLRFMQKNKDDYFYDLNEIFTKEELERLGERVLYVSLDNGEQYPIAIDITDASCFEDEPLHGSKIYMAIVINSPHVEHVKDWIGKEIKI